MLVTCPVSFLVLADIGAWPGLVLLLLPHQVGGHGGQPPVLPHLRLKHLQGIVTTTVGLLRALEPTTQT